MYIIYKYKSLILNKKLKSKKIMPKKFTCESCGRMHYPSTEPLMCKNPEKKRIRSSDYFLVIKEKIINSEELEIHEEFIQKIFNSIKEAAIYLKIEPHKIYNAISRGIINEWCDLPILGENNETRLLSIMRVEKKDIVNKLLEKDYLKEAKE
jgi:hypothetical protein